MGGVLSRPPLRSGENGELERRKSGGFLKEVHVTDLYDHLDTIGAYLKELAGAFGKLANCQWGRARHLVANSGHPAPHTVIMTGAGARSGSLLRGMFLRSAIVGWI